MSSSFAIILFLFAALLIYTTEAQFDKIILHGRYFGPSNNTHLFSPEIRQEQIEIGWILQPLDHFNHKDTRTWYQKYARNSTYFKTGGPACIFVSGEGKMEPRWVVAGQVTNYCRELNGVMYNLEHRYYGDSHPTRDATVENLKYLSISQALKDIARFIEFVHLNENQRVGKVILSGGSYAGSLVAYFRQKYPRLAEMALASSAPIIWKYDFKEYLEMVGQSFKSHSPKCFNKIKTGMGKLVEIAQKALVDESKEGIPINDLLQPLALCNKIYSNKTMDILNLYSTITGAFSYYVQYNSVNPATMPVGKLCEKINSISDPFESFAKLLNLMAHQVNDDGCYFADHDLFCEWMKRTDWTDSNVKGGARMWLWQVCNEVASFQTSNSRETPFSGVSDLFFVKQCECAFGKRYTKQFIGNAVKGHMAFYGDYKTIRSRVIFTNGQKDPWSSIGVINPGQVPTLHGANQSIENCLFYIEGASHCNDLLPDRKTDSTSLRNARSETLNCMKRWMKL